MKQTAQPYGAGCKRTHMTFYERSLASSETFGSGHVCDEIEDEDVLL